MGVLVAGTIALVAAGMAACGSGHNTAGSCPIGAPVGTCGQPGLGPAGGQGGTGESGSPTSLGPLASMVSASTAQLLRSAIAKMPGDAQARVKTNLDALPVRDARRLADDLDAVIAAVPSQAQSYVDDLMGVGTGGEQRALRTVNSEVLDAVQAPFNRLPEELAAGDQQVAQYLSQLLSTTLPNLRTLLDTGLARIGSALRPVVAADAAAMLAKLSPDKLLISLDLFLDSQAASFKENVAYQAGYDCGAAIMNTCSPFDEWVLQTTGAISIPEGLQQAGVDCAVLPLCSASERDAMMAWIGQEAAASAVQQAAVSAMATAMQYENLVTNERWIDAFEYPGVCPDPRCPHGE